MQVLGGGLWRNFNIPLKLGSVGVCVVARLKNKVMGYNFYHSG